MAKFILKTSFFVLPILILYSLNCFLYNPNEGDLVRLGYIYNNPLPSKTLKNKFKPLQINYKQISEIKGNSTSNQYDILTIGDSFSEQMEYGYKNYLAKDFSVLHINRFISKNQVQTLIGLINGDFFEKNQTKYVVLQIVERNFTSLFEKIKLDTIIQTKILYDSICNRKTQLHYTKNSNFFSESTIKIPLINILYNFNPNPLISKTYKVKTSKPLFSNNINNLLFYYQDIELVKNNNISQKVKKANEILNIITRKLKRKNIKLILLISPDKYDLYFRFIVNKDKFPKPLFFNLFNDCKKEYLYVQSKEILLNKINQTNNIYYYDDTHWSPVAASCIAKEIRNIILSTE